MKIGKRKRASDIPWALAMGLPGLALLVVFVLAPLVLGLGWSFTNKRLISPIPTAFVGLSNYVDLLAVRRVALPPQRPGEAVPEFRDLVRSDPSGGLSGFSELARSEREGAVVIWAARDPSFWRALFNTLRFVLVIVPCQGGLALVLALLVNTGIKGKNVFRTIYFVPVVVSMAVISIVWMFILNPDQGLLNRTLALVTGGGAKPIAWLVDARYAHIAIYLVSIWQSAGFQMVIFLAGLQGIPVHLYESARIDGAGPLRRFSAVTLPMLRNTTVFVVISTTILAFRVFTQIDVMTRGGPQESTISLIYYVVQKGFREQRVGYASAVTVVFFLFVLAVSLVQKATLKSEREID